MHLHILSFASTVKIDVNAFMSEEISTTSQSPGETVTLAWINLMRAQQRLLAAMERDFKSAGMPPLGWYDVLWELARSDDGRLRPFEIEERTLLAQYNLSRLIDRLEKKGLVERRTFDDDGRGRWVAITEKGRRLRTEMWEVYAQSIARHLGAKLPDGDAARLASLLSRLA